MAYLFSDLEINRIITQSGTSRFRNISRKHYHAKFKIQIEANRTGVFSCYNAIHAVNCLRTLRELDLLSSMADCATTTTAIASSSERKTPQVVQHPVNKNIYIKM